MEQTCKAETVLWKINLPKDRTLERLKIETPGNNWKYRMGYAGCMCVMGKNPFKLWFALTKHIEKWHRGEYLQ